MSLLGVADRLLHQRQPHACHTGHIDLNAVSATVCALNQTGSRTCVLGLCWAQACDFKAAAQDDGGQRDDSLSASK